MCCKRSALIGSSGCECFGRPNATDLICRRELNGGKCSSLNQSCKSISNICDSDELELIRAESDLESCPSLFLTRVADACFGGPLLWGDSANGGVASVSLRFPILSSSRQRSGSNDGASPPDHSLLLFAARSPEMRTSAGDEGDGGGGERGQSSWVSSSTLLKILPTFPAFSYCFIFKSSFLTLIKFIKNTQISTIPN